MVATDLAAHSLWRRVEDGERGFLLPCAALAAIFLLLSMLPATAREHRVALVIGNGAYKAAPLRNPVGDARAMAEAIRELGFEVIRSENATRTQMLRVLREFRDRLRPDSVGLVYYAGHGIQVKGANYLVPVDSLMQSEMEVEEDAINLQQVLTRLEEAGNALNIVILDACRDNPFERSFRSRAQGLAQVDAPYGTIIGYATAPGRVAGDGSGKNGLYTGELLKALRIPGLSIEDLFKQVRLNVQAQSKRQQVPWEASSLVGSFYFSGPPSTTPTVAAPATPPADVDADTVLWDSVRGSGNASLLQAYLERFPSGRFAVQARAELSAAQVAAAAIPAPPRAPQHPLDGRWYADVACDSPGRASWKSTFMLIVSDGETQFEKGIRYTPGWWWMSGRFNLDGLIEISGSGVGPQGNAFPVSIRARAVNRKADGAANWGADQCRFVAHHDKPPA